MCQYCDLLSGDSSNLGCNDLVTMERHNNTFSIEINGTYDDDRESIEIDYCMFCGRKLGDDKR